jgi:NAD-dependent SIR2 family protein deacetylase
MNDLISRQAAIDAVFGRSHDIIKQRLKNLPSAQPERKKGYWYDCQCSECGWSFEVESGFIGNPERFRFCPNCGADMRGEQNE